MTNQPLNAKTKELVEYLIAKHHVSTVTSLIKLCYLSDLVSVKERSTKISSFEYVRWYYGPYDKAINDYLYELVKDGEIKSEIDYTPDGQEYVKYKCTEEVSQVDHLTDDDLGHVNAVLESLKGFGAKALTEVAYKTKPMKQLNATLGGREHLGEKLDLSAV